MTDYIKREDVINFIANGVYTDTEADMKYTINKFNEYIPSADVVEVVRCKDCKKYNTDDCMMIHGKKMNRNIFANDYCSYGEREKK